MLIEPEDGKGKKRELDRVPSSIYIYVPDAAHRYTPEAGELDWGHAFPMQMRMYRLTTTARTLQALPEALEPEL